MTWSDGALPIGFSIATLKAKHTSKPRNPILADICFRAGYIESWGRGTIKILNACKEAELLEPSFEEKEGGLNVTLFNGLDTGAGTNVIRNIINSEFTLKDTSLKNKLYDLLKVIVENEGKRVADYKELTDIKAKTLERYLGQLRSAGLIEFKGANQFGGYYLTDKTKELLK